MRPLTRHLTRTFIAGIVALLPVAGVVLSVVFAESAIADSWLAGQPFYFPGLGLLVVVLATYLIGLTVTTYIGKSFWRLFDDLLEELPALGTLYRTLKQVLGYGDGRDAMFERVVLVPGRDRDGHEIGLVTKTLPPEADGGPRLVVFVPAAPSPTSGRVVVIEEARTLAMQISVHEAMKFLVALGKLEMTLETARA